MKKIINDPRRFVPEMLDGLLKAHPDQLTFAAGDPHCIVRADAPVKGKVALATGGGSGHLPVFLGYVGKGLLDGCAVGEMGVRARPCFTHGARPPARGVAVVAAKVLDR